MAILPIVALVSKPPTSKSLAVIEGLVLVLLITAPLAYGLALTSLPREVSMSVALVLGIYLAGVYARFASS